MKAIFSYFIVHTTDDKYLMCFGVERDENNVFLYVEFAKEEGDEILCDVIPASSVISIVQYVKTNKVCAEKDITKEIMQ